MDNSAEIISSILGAVFSGAGTYLLSKIQLKKKYEAKLPVEKVCNIIFDGPRGAGKTTFISKIVSPAHRDIPKMTPRHYATDAIPICWSRGMDKTEIFSLRAFDTAGEDDGTAINAIDEIDRDLAPGEKCVLVILWDLSQDALNKEKLNPSRLKAVFNSDKALRRIQHVIVFLNKIDVARSKVPHFNIETVQRAVRQYVSGNLSRHGQISVYAGSAQTGEGIYSCYGEIIRQFGLEGNFSDLNRNHPQSPSMVSGTKLDR